LRVKREKKSGKRIESSAGTEASCTALGAQKRGGGYPILSLPKGMEEEGRIQNENTDKNADWGTNARKKSWGGGVWRE